MFSHVRRPFLLLLAAMSAAIVAFALAGSTESVDAQLSESARFTVEAADPDADTVTVTVALDPGTSRIAALTAGLSFDADALSAQSCEVAITGVCNVVDGEVKFAGLSVNGFDEVDDFLTVTFAATGDTADAIPLELQVETASDYYGMLLDDVELVGAELHMVEALGSMTGDVIDAGSGIGLYDIDVCAALADQAAACVRTSGLGSFVIDELASGTYTVVISDPAGLYAPITELVDVESPALTTGIVVELSPTVVDEAPAPVVDEAPTNTAPAAQAGEPSTVSGMVTDQDTGDAIFGLQVCATMPVIGTQACSYTSSTGEYRIEGLDTGNYNVTVSDPGQRFAATDADRFVGVTSETGAASVDFAVARN